MRRSLTVEDRIEIAAGVKAGSSLTVIAGSIGRSVSVVSREVRRNSAGQGRYRPATADRLAADRRRRPQVRRIDADPVLSVRVRADLRASRTPRQIAGRLRLEARDPTVGPVNEGPSAAGGTVSHEAIYRWIYALPKGELARQGIVLQSKRTSRRRRRPVGERPGDYARIVGMVSIDARPDHVADRRVPGWWEGDLVIGKGGKSAVATLVERTSRFVTILGLPAGKRADAVADVLIDHLAGLPALLRQGLTWDQGTELAGHATVTVAADLLRSSQITMGAPDEREHQRADP